MREQALSDTVQAYDAWVLIEDERLLSGKSLLMAPCWNGSNGNPDGEFVGGAPVCELSSVGTLVEAAVVATGG